MLSAPLMAGNDLRNMDKKIIEVLTNKEVIAVNKDPKGMAALKWLTIGNLQIWVKPMENDTYAVTFLNTSDKPYDLDFNIVGHRIRDNDFGWVDYIIDENYKMRDLWRHKELGKADMGIRQEVPAHGVVMIKFYK